LFIVYCLLFIVYCLLFIVYCLLFIVYCLLFIVYWLLFIVYYALFIIVCWWLFVVWCLVYCLLLLFVLLFFLNTLFTLFKGKWYSSNRLKLLDVILKTNFWLTSWFYHHITFTKYFNYPVNILPQTSTSLLLVVLMKNNQLRIYHSLSIIKTFTWASNCYLLLSPSHFDS
jgi:hypothetical protein